MAITTYSELKTALENYVDRDDIDTDELIDLTEARHKRDVRIREMMVRDDIAVDSRQIALPDDFLEMIQLRLLTDPATVMQEVNIHEMTRIRDEGTGKPKYFVVMNELEFNKEPDVLYSGEIIYWKELTALSSSNTSNAILSRAPDLYLYGALVAAEPFLFNDERLPIWEKLYTSARDRLNEMDRRRSGPMVSRVVGDTP